MTEYRTIVLSVTATIEIPDGENPYDHQRSLCNVIKGIPDVTCVEVESSKISGNDELTLSAPADLDLVKW